MLKEKKRFYMYNNIKHILELVVFLFYFKMYVDSLETYYIFIF